MDQRQVVIVGGGLAGLTAALHLAERGLKPLVIEADPNFAGGRLSGKAAVKINSSDGQSWVFQAEHGIHGLWSQYLNLEEMLHRNGLTPKLVAANRQEWIHGVRKRVFRCEMGRIVRRSWIPAPFHYASLFIRPSFLNMLTLRDCLMWPWAFLSLLVAVGVDPMVENKGNHGLQERTMADLCRNWPPSLQAFVATLVRSGLSAHPETVPLSGFIAFMRFYTLLRRDSQAFRYFADDSDRAIVKPLIERISALGGEVCLGLRVSSIESLADNYGWRVRLEKSPNDLILSRPASKFDNADKTNNFEATIETRYLVLATDAPGTARILSNSPDTKEIADNLKWPGALETIVIRTWFDNAPPRKAEAGLVSGNFTIDNFFWLHRFQDNVASWHKATGGSLAEMHIYGPPEIVAQPDDVLQVRAVNDIQRIYPSLRGHLINATVQRNSPTHTLFGVGSIHNHLGTITPWPKLFCCGDWVRHPAPALFLERACVTGIAAANAVLEDAQLPIYAFTPFRPPEPFANMVQSILRGASRSLAKGRKAKQQRLDP